MRIGASAARQEEKIKKQPGSAPPPLALEENPDILATIGLSTEIRPSLVFGFAAETENLVANATAKLERKGADWIVANDVSPETGVFGGDSNTVRILSRDGVDSLPLMSKEDVGRELTARIAKFFDRPSQQAAE